MNRLLWIVQLLLALVFLGAGAFKFTQPKEKIATSLAWANDFTAQQIKLIGLLEILGGLGLVLPQLMGLLPWLTPLAAVGLALTMIGAGLVHVRRGELNLVGINAVLLLTLVVVAVAHL